MRSLGLDVGGANTKAILLEDGVVRKHWLEYIPLWKNKEALSRFLKNLASSVRPDVIGVTMTGELCDVFQDRREGVAEIIETVCEVVGKEKCLFVSLNGTMLTYHQSLAHPQKLAAANWIASTSIVGRKHPDCIFVDTGSTTTDILPIKGGKQVVVGHTDFQRLRTGELVYTGLLRTPLHSIYSEMLLDDKKTGIATENFAIMADVYIVLRMIEKEAYSCETPDGREKNREACMRRIARVFCSDPDEMREDLIFKAAKIFHEKQVEQVAEALKKMMRLHKLSKDMEVVLTGLGRKILAEEAARTVGFEEIIDLASEYGEEAALMTPAFGAGLLSAEEFERGRRN